MSEQPIPGFKDGQEVIGKKIKLAKLQTNAFKALSKAHPALLALEGVGGLLKQSDVFLMLQDFFQLIIDGFNAGLGDAAKDLAEALFTPDNVELMQELGILTAEFVKLGLIPAIEGFKELSPVLQEALPYLKMATSFLSQMNEQLKRMDELKEGFRETMMVVYTTISNLPGIILEAFKDLGQKIIDTVLSQFGGSSGGGGGSSDGDETWWWPFD